MFGNIIAILDSNANVVVNYAYDAWGNHKVLDASGNAITATAHIGHRNPFRYRGYFYDRETGLYYLKSRYYDPQTGRFINMDSMEYADPSILNGLNLYAYCNNNPVMYVDPNGNAWWLILIVGALIGGTLTLTSCSTEPTREEKEQIEKIVKDAETILEKTDNGEILVNINIDLTNPTNRIPQKLDKYLAQKLYEKSVEELFAHGYTLSQAKLMSVKHIAWEYRVHVAGYGWFESCDTANLNYGETWGTIIKRALGG